MNAFGSMLTLAEEQIQLCCTGIYHMDNSFHIKITFAVQQLLSLLQFLFSVSNSQEELSVATISSSTALLLSSKKAKGDRHLNFSGESCKG